jgi:hypothetical protein
MKKRTCWPDRRLGSPQLVLSSLLPPSSRQSPRNTTTQKRHGTRIQPCTGRIQLPRPKNVLPRQGQERSSQGGISDPLRTLALGDPPQAHSKEGGPLLVLSQQEAEGEITRLAALRGWRSWGRQTTGLGGARPGSVHTLLANLRWEGRLLQFLELSGVGRLVEDGSDEEGIRVAKMDGWWRGNTGIAKFQQRRTIPNSVASSLCKNIYFVPYELRGQYQ